MVVVLWTLEQEEPLSHDIWLPVHPLSPPPHQVR